MNQWFQNTRGLVIVGLAIATCAVLLAVEPSDSFPKTAAVASGSDSGTSVTTVPAGATTTTSTTVARPTLQQGSTGADVTVLQQRLLTLGFNVGTPYGSFGPGTKAAVIAFQTQKGITPADGTVNAATWTALLANA